MCGIVGYIGNRPAYEILVKGLHRLEYRGYDSAGVAMLEDNGKLNIYKTRGKVADLEKFCADKDRNGAIGIAHTRWATHGEPNDINAHPHVSQSGHIALVHNGTIENYAVLREALEQQGLSFKSDTDTEVLVQLIDYIANTNQCTLIEAVREALHQVVGAYAIAVVDTREPDTVIGARKSSPLVLGIGKDEVFLASDATPIIEYTDKVVYLNDDEIAIIRRGEPLKIITTDNRSAAIDIKTLKLSVSQLEKGGYPHFMLKEIHEQPEALKNTILPRMLDRLPDFRDDGIPDSLFAECSQVRIIACGTAMHAGMVAKALMEPMLRIPVTVSIASEFRYEDPLIDSSTLVIVISQSGETIDTLAAMNLAKSLGSVTLSIVNVKGSTIARESDYVLYTHAGPEIAVASTKAYSVQLAALYMIGCRMALVRGAFGQDEAREFMTDLLDVIPAMETVIGQSEFIQSFVRHLIRERDTFFIGRGLDYAFSLEGALKLKEISYIHAEAYAAGELKHGTIALIYDNVPVIAIATQDHVFAKTISNIREVKARGAYVILLAKKQSVVEDGVADIELRIPDLEDRFTVFPIAVALQLIAYYASIGKHLDVDQPRNLAKSVTVE